MIRGLGDYKKDDKKDKKVTTSYAGGEKSGMAVENPTDIDGIVEKAKQGGREHASAGKAGAPATELKITLYSNGFVVGDGPFRDYEGPENKQFMKELNEGYVPNEIRGKYPGGISVGLEDKRKEAYRPPTPPKYVAYSGQG
jgi:UBX domain-containing protein 1